MDEICINGCAICIFSDPNSQNITTDTIIWHVYNQSHSEQSPCKVTSLNTNMQNHMAIKITLAVISHGQ